MEKKIEWIVSGKYEDIKYDKFEGIAKITINRPEVGAFMAPIIPSKVDLPEPDSPMIPMNSPSSI